MPGAPGCVVEGGGVPGCVEVGIAFGPGRVGGDAEVKQNAEAFEILGASEAGEERAAYL